MTTLLLAVAALATAWASYQAARWHGEQARAFSQANAARIESTRASGLESRQVLIDVTTFAQWVDAYVQDDTALAGFYRERFRDEFKPAVDAWIATRPLENPASPQTPFALPEYRLARARTRLVSKRRRRRTPSKPPTTSSARTNTSSAWSCSPRRCSSPG